MKFLILITLLSMMSVACTREDHAGTVGSGAGIQEEEETKRSDADKARDMNITTPIYDEEEED